MQPNPDDFLEREHAPSGSALYYALLFSAREPFAHRHRRKASIALHALRQGWLDIIAGAHDPQVRDHKINWWSDEIMEAREGRPRHPVSIALSRYGGREFWRRPEATSMLRAAARAAAEGLSRESDRERFCHDFGGNCLVLEDRLPNAPPQDTPPASEQSPPPLESRPKNAPRIATLKDCGRAIECATLANPPPGLWLGLQRLCEKNQSPPDNPTIDPGQSPKRKPAATPIPPRRQRLRHARKALQEALDLVGNAEDPLFLKTRTLIRIRQAEIERALAIETPRPVSITPLRKLFIAWRCARKASGS